MFTLRRDCRVRGTSADERKDVAMRHLSPLAKAQHAIRQQVCSHCRFGPQGADRDDSHQWRLCEKHCPIFLNLPALRHVAGQIHVMDLGTYEHAVRDEVCQHCTLSDSAGDYCSAWMERQCPLSVYLNDVVSVLERVEPIAQKSA